MIVSAKPQTPLTAHVRVAAPARLHLGFVDLHGGLGRRFGSLGLALDQPASKIIIRRAAQFSARGSDAERALVYARQLLRWRELPDAVAIEVEEAIPAHAGLGSGTQMALAVGCAVSRLFGLDLDAASIATILNRGGRSGIGIGAFQQGGFLVDGGRSERSASPAPPPLIARLVIPDSWRIVLIFDREREGVSGEAEKHAFAALPPFSEADAGNLCRTLLVQAMPALAEADIATFGRAISTIQRTVGDYFAPVQGGRFASPRVAEILQCLEHRGAAAVGQSSWGPTGFALYPGQHIAQQQLDAAQSQWREYPSLAFMLCRPRNQPASIQFYPYPPNRDHQPNVKTAHSAYTGARR